MNYMNITCKHATEYMVRKEEGKITLLQRYQLWKHLAVCRVCKLFDRQNKVVSISLKNASPIHSPSLDSMDREIMIRAMMEDDGLHDTE